MRLGRPGYSELPVTGRTQFCSPSSTQRNHDLCPFLCPLSGIQGQSVRMNVALPLCNPALLEMTPALPGRERDQLRLRKRVVDRHARQLTPHRRLCSAITTTDARIRAWDLASQIRRVRNPRNWHTVIACRSAFESSRSRCSGWGAS